MDPDTCLHFPKNSFSSGGTNGMTAAYKLKNFKILFIIVIELSSPVGLCLKSGFNCTFHTILCLSFLWPVFCTLDAPLYVLQHCWTGISTYKSVKKVLQEFDKDDDIVVVCDMIYLFSRAALFSQTKGLSKEHLFWLETDNMLCEGFAMCAFERYWLQWVSTPENMDTLTL